MPKFKVTAVSRTYLETVIEASSLETAQRIAEDGAIAFENFVEQVNDGDFQIFWEDTYEIKEHEKEGINKT